MGPVFTGIIGAFLVGGAISFYQQKKHPVVVTLLAIVGVVLMVVSGVQFFTKS
jgi:hypothetical protein